MLKDPEKPLDLNRAKAVVEVAQTIVNSAKVEVDLINALDGDVVHSTFFGADRKELDSATPKLRQIGSGQ
jgi:hypothetical protein